MSAIVTYLAAWNGPFLIPMCLLVISRLWFAVHVGGASEDAYISFRYARNWAQGLGPVFNAGEKVFGYSSPVWVSWLALGMRLGQDPLLWARCTSLAADVVTVATVGHMLLRAYSSASAWCFGVIFAMWPYWASLSMSGLEMSTGVGLLALGSWLVDRRSRHSGVVLGCLAVFRPEWTLATIVLAVWAPLRERLIGAGVAAGAFTVLALYYGSPVPHSVVAKAIAYGVPGILHSAPWWDWMLPGPTSGRLAATSEGVSLVLFSLIGAPAALAGVRESWRTRALPLAGAVCAGSAVWGAYVVSGTTFFFWYLALPLLTWCVLIAIGLPRITSGRLLPGACVVALSATWLFHPQLYLARQEKEADVFGSAGDYLSQMAAPGSSVLLEPIGTIGWRAGKLRLIDEVGLTSPAVSQARERGAGWYTRVVQAERPDWLVVRAGILAKGAGFAAATPPFRDDVERGAVLSQYEVVAMGDTSAGDQKLLILARMDSSSRALQDAPAETVPFGRR